MGVFGPKKPPLPPHDMRQIPVILVAARLPMGHSINANVGCQETIWRLVRRRTQPAAVALPAKSVRLAGSGTGVAPTGALAVVNRPPPSLTAMV